jgi:outer membrane protein assembly factor BamB
VLHAYDAAGQANCSGTPKVCEPLWTADVGDHSLRVSSTPVASGGTVYVVDPARRLWAFDGAGVDSCSGEPRHCGPLWTADLPPTSTTFPLDAPAVANGRVYAGSAVYDADGVTGCAGHPTVCSPLWPVDGGGPFPVVANDVELTGGGLGSGGLPVPLHAFDANGAAACAGTPAVCEPLWTFEPPGPVYDSPAVQSGVVYIVVSGNPGQFEPARLHALSPP